MMAIIIIVIMTKMLVATIITTVIMTWPDETQLFNKNLFALKFCNN